MAVFRKIKTGLHAQNDTGFSVNSDYNGGRFINKDGSPNIIKSGIPFLERFSPYHTLLEMPSWKFLLVIIGYYTVINIFFAFIYIIIGIENLQGMHISTPLGNFGEAFFFSAQTFTTVGYGRISPVGFLSSTVAAFEAMIGLLTFAIATGLFYARFSQPKAYIQFSSNAIIAPYKSMSALMLRLVPFKNNMLTNPEIKLTMGVKIEENGKLVNKFYQLPLELSKVNSLTLSWTVVHPIDSESPFYQLQEEDIKNLNGEIIVYLSAFDDAYSNTVVARTSYTVGEIIYGAKFIPMFHPNASKNRTVLEIDKLSEYEKVNLQVEYK